ncbi:CBASS oligonucleotide cyclase [Candidatus Hydrogenedentota bacterium]
MNNTDQSRPQQFITHQDIASFADGYINLSDSEMESLLNHYKSMSDTLDRYVAAHPDCGLIRMYSCGSMANRVAMKGFDFHNTAIYVNREITPETEPEMLDWFASQLREVYPHMPSEQIFPKGHVVWFDLEGKGIDVMVTPIQYDDQTEDTGWQIARETGQRVMLSIPMRLKLVKDCRRKVPRHFAQVLRLLNWWVEQRHKTDPDFRFKSILIQITCAHLLDIGTDFTDYPSALKAFFTFIAESGLQERMLFETCSSPTEMPAEKVGPVEIFDPYNKENNIANGYSEDDRMRIVNGAREALKAITLTQDSSTREEAAAHWQDVLGPEFKTA